MYNFLHTKKNQLSNIFGSKSRTLDYFFHQLV